MNHPLILSLQVDRAAQALYEDLRRRYFPPERNLIPAHLTLFHQLPDDGHTWRTVRDVASTTKTFLLREPKVRSIGRGVAVFFEAEPIATLHGSLSSAFSDHLIPQDRQRFRPHIVVQNKVDAETARQTLLQLQHEVLIEPKAAGLTLWRYMGGPWEHLGDVHFEDEEL